VTAEKPTHRRRALVEGSAEDLVASPPRSPYLSMKTIVPVDGWMAPRKERVDYGLSFRAETVAGAISKSAHRRDTSANR